MKKTTGKSLLLILAPLVAAIALGASSYFWYKALVPEVERISIPIPFNVSPDAFSSGLEGNIRDTLGEMGIPENNLVSRAADEFQDNIRNIYTISIPQSSSLMLFNHALTRMTKAMGGDVIRGVEGSNGNALTLTVGVGKKSTDIIVIRKRTGTVSSAVRVAVVIDDLGIKSVDLARRLCNLDRGITLAILPFQNKTSDIVNLANKTGTPYILHMPMEPKSSETDPGRGAILSGDNAETIILKLDRAFREVPGTSGINNHMGSKVTEEERIMEHVIGYLRNRGGFFLDSQTSRVSVGYDLALKMGVRGAKISGYIDVEDNEEAIAKRIDTLTDYALKNGSAIILGHDRPNTVAVLERKIPEMENKGIRFVYLSELLH